MSSARGDAGDREQGFSGKVRDAADDLERAAGARAGSRSAKGLHFGGCAFADHTAFVDDDDAVGESVGLFEVVGGEQDGFAARSEGADLGPHTPARFDVEADGGLVEEDEVRIAGESEGEEDALLLAAGELAEHARLDAFEAGSANQVGIGHGIGVVAAKDIDVLANPEHLGGPADLQHDAGTEARGGVARVGVEDADGAAGRRAQPHEELDGGRFAGSIWAQESDDLSAMQGKRDVVQRDHAVAVTLGDVRKRGDGSGGFGEGGRLGSDRGLRSWEVSWMG